MNATPGPAARTPDQILQQVIGLLHIQLAIVQSEYERATQELAELKAHTAAKTDPSTVS